jgi:multiple antibiotic resistance protein
MISVGSAAIGALITSILIYLCYRYARQLVNKLGPFGTIVALRLSAFILLCIGIEIFWLGLSGALVDLGLINK